MKQFLPPVLVDFYKRTTNKYGWFGDYPSWQDAQNDSTGYDSISIAEKVKDALLEVKNGKAEYERDSVLFDKIEYSWPVLAALMWIANQNKGRLNVLDFGGSLGSAYFQNRKFLSSLEDVKWNIAEQSIFVEYGKKFFEDDRLRFFETIESCFRENHVQVLVFSCVLQYLEFPFKCLDQVFKFHPRFIIIDNMPFLKQGKDRITIQKVPPEIYSASYPCWLLNKSKFLEVFHEQYELIADFKSSLSISLDGHFVPYEGFIFKRNVKKF